MLCLCMFQPGGPQAVQLRQCLLDLLLQHAQQLLQQRGAPLKQFPVLLPCGAQAPKPLAHMQSCLKLQQQLLLLLLNQRASSRGP